MNRKRGTTGISILVLLVSGGAVLAVPPSSELTGISETERQLLSLILPLLLAAIGAALVGVVSAFSGGDRLAGLFGVLSLLLVNVAALLAGQFGQDGIGLPATLVVTSPLAIIYAARETSYRRIQREGDLSV